MGLVLFITFLLCFIMFPTVRCAFFHPVLLLLYGFRDFSRYLRRKQYNFCRVGELVAYTGLFGRGKTLSVVHRVVKTYRAFDGKKVWCPRRKRIVTQKVRVLSNVSLKIPFEPLESLQQIVDVTKAQEVIDNEDDTLTVILVLGDEFSVQMNSRNFRDNIDPLFLNTLLTCRHYYLSIYYTAQRFNHVDALLRQVTSYVVECSKFWRFQRLSMYDAWDLENAKSPKLVAPFARSCWFIRDEDYNSYDTLAVVKDLNHRVEQRDMMSPEEILSLQQNQGVNMEAVSKPSRRWRKSRQKDKN